MQRYYVRCLTVVIFVLCATAPLYAAPEGGGTNPMEFRADTAIWSIVVFAALLFILWKNAWGPILEGLQKREETIRSSLEEAKRTRVEMEQLRQQFQKELADAHQQIPKLMEEARRDAEALSSEMRAKAMADIQADRERLRREVEIAKDQAIKEIWEQTAQLATLISAQAIGRALNADDHRRLLDEGLREMSAAAKN